jgi:hypothetical protein
MPADDWDCERKSGIGWAKHLLWHDFRDQMAQYVPSFERVEKDGCAAVEFCLQVIERCQQPQPLLYPEFEKMLVVFLCDVDERHAMASGTDAKGRE